MGYLLKSGEKWIYNDGSDNGVVVEDDGSFKKVGTAIVYEDLLGDALSFDDSGWTTYIEKDLDENTVDFLPNGDITDSGKRGIFNIQLKHQIAEGANSFFRMHWHWLQSDTTERTFTVQYRKVKKTTPGEAGTAVGAWSTAETVTMNSTNNFYTYSSGTIHQITEFTAIDISDMLISDVIQFRVAREDSESGNLKVMYLDAHVAVESDGSQYKWVKS